MYVLVRGPGKIGGSLVRIVNEARPESLPADGLGQAQLYLSLRRS